MGRRIYCHGLFVYKYTFGEQDSEIGKICDEFGIGTYEAEPEILIEGSYDSDYRYEKSQMYGDRLTITKEDVVKLLKVLDEQTEYLKKVNDLLKSAEDLQGYNKKDGSYTCSSDYDRERKKIIEDHPEYLFFRMVKAITVFAEKRFSEDETLEELEFDGEW
jgi:hypothetical protein